MTISASRTSLCVVGVAICLVFVSCSKESTAEPNEQIAAETVAAPGDRLTTKIESITVCMKRLGFDYVYRDLDVSDEFDALGSLRLDSAATSGYFGLVSQVRGELAQAEFASQPQVRPGPEYYSALNDGDQVLDHDHDGSSDHDHGDQDPDGHLHENGLTSSKGCRGLAEEEVTQLFGPSPAESFATGFQQVFPRVQALPAYQDLVDEWAECMRNEGYQPSSSPDRQTMSAIAQAAARLDTTRQSGALSDPAPWKAERPSTEMAFARIEADAELLEALDAEIAMAVVDSNCRQDYAAFVESASNEVAADLGLLPLYPDIEDE